MDSAKLEGIVSAIEAESLQPSPSHNNLARLVSMFCRELITEAKKVEETPPVQEQKIEIPQASPITVDSAKTHFVGDHKRVASKKPKGK